MIVKYFKNSNTFSITFRNKITQRNIQKEDLNNFLSDNEIKEVLRIYNFNKPLISFVVEL